MEPCLSSGQGRNTGMIDTRMPTILTPKTCIINREFSFLSLWIL